MGIAPKFGSGLIAAQVQAFEKRLEQAAIFQMQYLGEELVKYAKAMRSYKDRTGNLTNSMGYAVAKGTEILYFGGPQQSGPGNDAALRMAKKMLEPYPNRISLIIVAGMNYAAYVEAKGYNVILPAELKAKTEFPQTMQKLMEKARAKAKEQFGIAV